ncbi:D-alanyl-D-alanine carboxypeptidase [Candidatus Nomurabacteria bacterium]|nr:D-alanyl-D-alanine carboxypeptidase [Candidatus Nomurabacteria bacterium]
MEIQKPKHTKEIVASVILITVLGIILGIFFVIAQKQEKAKEEMSTEEVGEIKVNPLDKVVIEGKAGLVIDLNSQETYYAKNTTMILPLASITKLMTVLVAYEVLGESAVVQLGIEQWRTEGESAIYPGENFKIMDLINLTLVASSNDGAAALAYAAGQKLNQQRGNPNANATGTFVAEMNALAKKIDMNNTVYYNPTGLDLSDGSAGAKGTVRDLEKMFQYMIKSYPELLEATKDSRYSTYSQQGIGHNLENTNEIVNSLPNLLGSKTGFTDTAGGNLAVVIDPGLNTPIMIAVLGSTKEGRFNDVKKLSDTLLEYFSSEGE